jgi:hypothetical protein
MPAQLGLSRCPEVVRCKPRQTNCASSIAAHPCQKRKDGAPSVGMVPSNIVKVGPPAP